VWVAVHLRSVIIVPLEPHPSCRQNLMKLLIIMCRSTPFSVSRVVYIYRQRLTKPDEQTDMEKPTGKVLALFVKAKIFMNIFYVKISRCFMIIN